MSDTIGLDASKEIKITHDHHMDATECVRRLPAVFVTESRGERELIHPDTTYLIQTSDGPENEMFAAGSTSRSSAGISQTEY